MKKDWETPTIEESNITNNESDWEPSADGLKTTPSYPPSNIPLIQ